jgi:ABC-type sugar transport system ATPase subunit
VLSIAAKWLDDMNNTTLNEAQRATAKKNYTELIATAGFPNKPDGSKMTCRGVIEQIGTPLELFDKPGNLFVAQFIGSPAMNVLSGTQRRGADGAYVEALGSRWRPARRHGAPGHRGRARSRVRSGQRSASELKRPCSQSS